MLQFVRDGKEAVAKVDCAIPTYDVRVFSLRFNCNSEVYAGLLTEALRKAVGDAVQEARREAYAQGWRDAKAKSARSDYFRRTI